MPEKEDWKTATLILTDKDSERRGYKKQACLIFYTEPPPIL